MKVVIDAMEVSVLQDPDVLARIKAMIMDGGRTVNGRWCGIHTGITLTCKREDHDRCGGWIFPLGGKNECSCPCHDKHRDSYESALSVAESLGW